MKPLLSLLLFVLISLYSNAQIVDIPDANFKVKLLEASTENEIAKNLNGNFFKIDTNNDGELQTSEVLQVSDLDLFQSGISDLTGIETFINIEELKCSSNNISNIDITQNINLEKFWINNNQLTSIDVSENINLVRLALGNNQLTNLDVSANTNLTFLTTSGNQITGIDISENINLTYLQCSNNQIANLDVSENINLTHLYCENNQISEIDVTQNVNLDAFKCDNNQLTTINVTQNLALSTLSCDYNQITEVDVSQNVNLHTFGCSNNQLTTLDISQNINIDASHSFNCNNNLLSTLFIKNGGNVVGGGTNFLPNPNLVYICANEADLDFIQLWLEYYEVPENVILVNDFCDFTPGGDFNTISGSIVLDLDSNGCDATDSVLSNIRVSIDDGTSTGSSFSNESGVYTFYTGIGNYELTHVLENPMAFNIFPETVTIPLVDDDNNTVNQDFCITPNGIHNDLEIVIVTIVSAAPGFDAYYKIVYKNKGNQMLSGSIDFTYDDSVLDLISTSDTPTIQNPGNLSWDYLDLNPFESRVIDVVFNVNSPMETPAVNIDDVLDFTVMISPVSGDETPDDNAFVLEQVVVGSFDPNDITCLEGDIVNPDQIGEYLHYNINFENTGTAAATFVVVKDVIDTASYDVSSIQILYASHPMETRVIDNTIEFIFDNINLAPEGKGNVVFKIKTNSTLTVGDAVSNQAEIFFDYNFPIVTNVATTNFQVLSVDEFGIDNTISVFPNPSKDLVTLRSKTNIKSIQVYDTMSRLVFETSADNLSYTLNVSDYSEGIYFLKIKTAFGEQVERLIKN